MTEKHSSKVSVQSLLLDNILPITVVAVAMALFVPLPKMLIDAAMVLNLAFAITILLNVIRLKRSADFSSFPRVVLIFTIFGLAINISSTRNILVHPAVGMEGMSQQSEMVKAVSDIVAGNNVLVGFIIFIILIVVQVLVITKGADRVSEVSARFTLDSMNSKMFVIQNQQSSGAITEEEAELKINQLRQEIDFYSTMDGSTKFVSGNVKAGIFITLVNLIGGMVTGIMKGMTAMDAMNSYAKLTIGDGLMSQIPALVLSFATGLLITGSNDEDVLSEQIKKQFSEDGFIYIIVGATLSVMAIAFHNGSTFVLLLVGLLFVFCGIRLRNHNEQKVALRLEEEARKNSEVKSHAASPEEVSAIAKLDDLSLEVGYGLIPLVDKDKGAELLERVKRIRRESALDMGLVIPPIHIMDQMELAPEEYSFKIRGIEVGRGRLKMGHFMCLNTGNVLKSDELSGERTKDPAFGMDAIWLPESMKMKAEKVGYAVVDAPTTIATHLTELIRRNAHRILSRQAVSQMIDEVKKSNPVVVDEVLMGDGKFSYGEIETILKNLLMEHVSIRNIVGILETLADYGRLTRDVWSLTEKVREALAMQICTQYCDENKVLHVLTFSQAYAEKIHGNSVNVPGSGPVLAFDPVDGRKFISAVSGYVAGVSQRNYLPIIMCPSEIRRVVKASTEKEMPNLVVLSINEVMAASPSIKVESLGEINE